MSTHYIVQKLDGRYLSSGGKFTGNVELAIVYDDEVIAKRAADYIGRAVVKTYEEAKLDENTDCL